MKKLLILSIAINLFFLLAFGYIIHRKGGLNYVKTKLGMGIAPSPDSQKPSWYYKNYKYWTEKKTMFEILPQKQNQIVFVGNSITDGCEWSELFDNPNIINRGIGGDNTEGLLERLSVITKIQPKKIFLELGINDLGVPLNTNQIKTNYGIIIDQIKSESPNTQIYVQSVLPTRDHRIIKNDSVIILNQKLLELANNRSLTFINLYDNFKDSSGNLSDKYSIDGVHLLGLGYLHWKDLIYNYVNDSINK